MLTAFALPFGNFRQLCTSALLAVARPLRRPPLRKALLGKAIRCCFFATGRELVKQTG